MKRFADYLLLAVFTILSVGGCCSRRLKQDAYCPSYVSQSGHIQVSPKQPGAGVVHDFGNVPKYEEVQHSLSDPRAATRSVAIDLQETVCLAARNSELADLLEAERHALACRSTECSSRTLDIILQGESLEQRNEAAGTAAKLFLGLCQINMQRELLEESENHLAELNDTIRAAAQAGLPTADGENELARGRIQWLKAQSELNVTEQKTMYQLNALLSRDSANMVLFHPVYELTPSNLELDVQQQIKIAETNRPGIRSMDLAISNGADTESIYRILGLFDARLGLRIPTVLTKRLILMKLVERLKKDIAPDASSATRKHQVSQIIAARKKATLVEVSEASLSLHGSLAQLAISNENIGRLKAERAQLKAKSRLDAGGSYLQLHQNWNDLLKAKSDRVAIAFEYESAKISLLQSQGLLVQQCGYGFADDEIAYDSFD